MLARRLASVKSRAASASIKVTHINPLQERKKNYGATTREASQADGLFVHRLWPRHVRDTDPQPQSQKVREPQRGLPQRRPEGPRQERIRGASKTRNRTRAILITTQYQLFARRCSSLRE
ncbi:unnamed protein product, partial [Nesidiocoris tenuis]